MASWGLWQPAVLGSTGTPSFRSRGQKPWLGSRPLAPWRRSEAVSMAGWARVTASSSTAGEG